jgi:type IX secretion system PorP/SprF family membrane protein
MKRILLILIIITGFCIKASSQQLPVNNQYLINKFSLSPAFAGFNGNIESFLGYRQNWVGVEGAPKTEFVDINGPLKEGQMGYGLTVTNDQTGNFRHFYADFAFAYHLTLGSDMGLNFGLSPKIYRNQLDLTSVTTSGNQQDPVIQNQSALAGTTFDLGIGVMFNFKNLYIGVDAPRSVGMKLKYKDSQGQYPLVRQYQAFATYQLVLNQTLYIDPMVIVRSTQNSPVNYEASVLMRYKQRIWLGGAFHAGNTIGLSVGGALSDRMVLNYTYELGTGGIVTKSSGTHEISIGFLIKPRKERKEPTIFPPVKDDEVDKKLMDEIDKRVKNVETALKTEIAKKDKEIKDLDNRLKKLEKNVDVVDAAQWQKPFVINNIKFANNSDKLFSSSFPELNKLVKQMTKEPELELKITGYTDNVGSPAYNMKLSERRAKSVRDYIVQQGVEEKRVLFEGKGDQNPVESNETPEGRASNRRIEGSFKK